MLDRNCRAFQRQGMRDSDVWMWFHASEASSSLRLAGVDDEQRGVLKASSVGIIRVGKSSRTKKGDVIRLFVVR